MLATLHPRIKAKFPSRFLSATLQALIAAFPFGSPHQDELASDVVAFVKVVSGSKRPPFPPRRTSSNVGISTLSSFPNLTLVNSMESMSTEEDKIHKRLLQSFITHMLDDYMTSLPHVEGVPGLAYCGRYLEKMEHSLIVPKGMTLEDQFSESEALESRLTTVGQLVALARDLDITNEELMVSILASETKDDGGGGGGDRNTEESYPASATDIPLSQTGSLYLYTARKAMDHLIEEPGLVQITSPTLSVFPDHEQLLKQFASTIGLEALSQEPEPFLDALLFHGLVSLEKNSIGEPKSDQAFAEYLQITSLLSANMPSDELRFVAYYLTTTVLRSHPRDLVRFGYIRDTLEYCPFENLRATAVGWIKGETVDAYQALQSGVESDADESLFLSSTPLSTLAEFLFPDVREQYGSVDDASESELGQLLMEYEQHCRLYVASLNFMYLLLKSVHLHERLQLRDMLEEEDVISGFVGPLHSGLQRLKKGLDAGTIGEGGKKREGPNEVELGLMACETVDGEVKKLGWGVME